MKRSKKMNLGLNKKTISNFKMNTVTGGSNAATACRRSEQGLCRPGDLTYTC